MDKNQKAIVDDGKVINYMHWGLRIGVGAIVAVAAYFVMPLALNFVETTFQVVLGVAKIALIGVPLVAGLTTAWGLRSWFKAVQERFINSVWETWIYNDPIKFITEAVQSFRKSMGQIKLSEQSLQEVFEDLTQMAEDMRTAAAKNLDLAEHTSETDERQAALYASFAQKKMLSIDNILASAMEVENAIEVVREIHQYMNYSVQEMEDDLEMMRHEMKLRSVTSFAADVARQAIHGTEEKNMRLAIAQRAYREQISKYAANFKSFMKDVEPLLKAERIREVIATAEGKKALQAFKENKESLGGLKDFNLRLDELRESLGKKKPGYKTDLTKVQTTAANVLTKGRTSKFTGLN